MFLELTSVDAAGARIFVGGNLHTERTTLYGILLESEDGGKTWTEPVKRIRAASLEQIQFADLVNGWISGQVIEPLPKDQFMLLTNDGGKTWRTKPVFDESRFGAISQFWFESKTEGELVIDHASKHEIFATNTGGESWELKEVTPNAVRLKGRREDPAWRLRADGKVFHLERHGAANWEQVARFQIHVADCK